MVANLLGTLVPSKSTFRYNSYVQFHSGVVFFFLLFLALSPYLTEL